MPDVVVHDVQEKRASIVFWEISSLPLKEMRKLELFIICFEIKKASLQLSPCTSEEVQKGILFGFIGTEKSPLSLQLHSLPFHK